MKTSMLMLLVCLGLGFPCQGHAAGRHGVPALDHVFLIMMENHNYDEPGTVPAIIGNEADAPYINAMAEKHDLATHYQAVGHPSLTNYLEMVGGSNFGVRADDMPDWHSTTCQTTLAPSAALSVQYQILDQAKPAGQATVVCPIAGSGYDAATPAIERTMADLHVPISVHGEFAGNAAVFRQTVNEEPLLILAALAAVYIVLGVLYESLAQPITILSTLPSSGVGAVLALLLFNEPFSLIALIGIILLIGVVLKNAIMMVDVALVAQRTERTDAARAIHEACLLRFRPIMMTTIAAMLGALPLALMSGQGSEMRRPLGIAVVGGLAISQILTLYTTPIVYIYLDRFRLWFARTFTRRARAALSAGSPAA